ncbi:hypothetical protein LTR91_003788 [Friedmanniomyces endolithicus]|uniref:Myb-like domain-containing protein n=1 Tax=Friedmanniomyces endolithicus TaxID=329885 RepID=A0AAN6KX24_9PEZI|nr:hypothetical protein LTS00_016487 [Friedmanniomyces endolithicus]KAK0305423.1 hypothetical protein LTR82_016793 [Friedmanniomyces endolithicus]KAK0827103.1 hypothetical protein LTR73_005886 [Friedmanniomyces endolithicus]KAK0975884.1 hypothetical protein LTR54_016661 [Friedmanniomyces endolithicus]KAK0986372.1 hypothetical protein LTS01_009897 [Friedmanniomyces endolithicus]
MDSASFQQYLQSSVLNTHPPQTFQARQQHNTIPPHQRYAIVPFAPRLCGCTMASTGAPHSFFADAMHHHRDEQTICEEYLRQPLALQPPAVPNFAYRPWVPPQFDAAPQRSTHPGTGLRLQVPGVLADEIKTEDFSPISDDDWAHASIEYEVPSPASAASMADSPVTPEFSGGAESYNDRFLGGGLHVNNLAGLACAQEIDFGAKPFIPPGRHSAAPAALQLLGYDHDLGTPMFVHVNSSADPYAETILAAADQTYGLPTFHSGRISDAHLSAHQPMMQPPIFAGRDMFRGSHLSLSDSDDASSLRSRPSDQKPVVLVSTAEETARARERDEILVQRRSEGWTYRKIKDHYRFPEAEPTLRGRHRMLTKEKEERVRRPVWTRRDVQLLRRAVAHFEATCRGKMPWKKVGDWVREHGGSYRFGGSTCAKKWDQLREGRE